MFMQGEFVQTYRTSKGSYGLTMAAIEQVAQQGLACVTHMSIEVHVQCLHTRQFHTHVPYVLNDNTLFLDRSRSGCTDNEDYTL